VIPTDQSDGFRATPQANRAIFGVTLTRVRQYDRSAFDHPALASVEAAGLVAFGIVNLTHLTHGEQTPTYLGVERTKG
jgi:hypothetical protein